MRQTITINARKYDRTIHRSWKCNFLHETNEYWLFSGIFEQEINHDELGIIKAGTISYEYYFKQKWFNVFRFHEPEGHFKFYYCNINMPPTFKNNVLDYVDLDLDILVNKKCNYKILDRDEFQENSVRFKYPDIVKLKVEQNLNDLLSIIRYRVFPFNDANHLKNINFHD